MCANGAYRRALAGAAPSLARSASAKVGVQWRRVSHVQRGEGNKNKNFVPYFSRIRRHRRGRDYDG